MKQYKIDPELEKCLPQLDDETYQGIKDSIDVNGYDKAFPIIVWEGHDTIVDGHHRYKACFELGEEPSIVEHPFESIDEAILYALEHQDNRRNQTETQKALNGVKRKLIKEKIAARERMLSGVADPRADVPQGRATDIIAKEVKVSPRTVRHVVAVLNKGVPELEGMLRDKTLSASAGDVFVHHTPIEKQKEIVVKGGAVAVNEHARGIKKELNADREARKKAEKESEEQRKFNEFNKTVAEKTAIANAKIDRVFGQNGDACLMPNMAQKWCKDCEWGFDIFLPAPGDVSCPYCKGSNLSKRDEDWNPREVV